MKKGSREYEANRRLQAMWGKPVAEIVYTGSGTKAPPCFSSVQSFETWAASFEGHVPHHGFCADCTAMRQGIMLNQGRCIYPTVTFARNEEGDLVGRREESGTRI